MIRVAHQRTVAKTSPLMVDQTVKAGQITASGRWTVMARDPMMAAEVSEAPAGVIALPCG